MQYAHVGLPTDAKQAYFNVMLKDMGVRGAKVHDVLQLEMLEFLP